MRLVLVDEGLLRLRMSLLRLVDEGLVVYRHHTCCGRGKDLWDGGSGAIGEAVVGHDTMVAIG